MKKGIIGFIIGAIIFGSIGVYATVTYSSDKITYKNTTVDMAITDLYKKVDTISGGYVALMFLNENISTSTSRIPITYNNEKYSKISTDNVLTIETPGTYRVLSNVNHSPTGATYTSSANIYVDNVKVGTAESNYHGSVMNNYEFTVEENQTSSIYVDMNSNGSSNGSRSIMVVVIKES